MIKVVPGSAVAKMLEARKALAASKPAVVPFVRVGRGLTPELTMPVRRAVMMARVQA
jgi:hypothetical protein